MAKNNNFLLNLKMPYNTSTGSALRNFNARPQAAGSVAVVTPPFSGKVNPTHRSAKTSPTSKEFGSDMQFSTADHFNSIRITP